MDKKDILQQAAKCLLNKGVILYPTETVWGLGCLSSNLDAYLKINTIKQRPPEKPYILLVDSWQMLCSYIDDNNLLSNAKPLALADEPTTIIYPKTKLAQHCCAENGSVAIRITQHNFCKQLIGYVGEPIVSTSANTSGKPATVKFEMLETLILNKVDFVIPKTVGEGNGQSSRLFSFLPKGTFSRLR